ncbi:hypothetical protein K1719_014520 [Acacia pycnantha]|nr:hypothetical protein K1719_014520 [Acacia pycnantha]
MWPSLVLMASPLLSFSRSDLWRSDYHWIARICVLGGRSKDELLGVWSRSTILFNSANCISISTLVDPILQVLLQKSWEGNELAVAA